MNKFFESCSADDAVVYCLFAGAMFVMAVHGVIASNPVSGGIVALIALLFGNTVYRQIKFNKLMEGFDRLEKIIREEGVIQR